MLNIITLNVNGLASNEGRVPKKRKLFTWLKAHHCDVALLQETHFTDSMQHIISQEWGGDSFFCNGSSNSRGVCILVRRGLDMEVKEVRRDNNGRFIFLKTVSAGKSILFGNIYCPNIDELESTMRINDWLSEMQADNIILAGDFNVTLDPTRDREWQQHSEVRDYCRRRSEALKETLEEFRLVDAWRALNPDATQFTFSRGSSKSRLDYFFISENMLLARSASPVKCNIMPPFLADHRAVQLNVCPIGQVRGLGYWKFNNSLLADDNFVTELSAFIRQAVNENDAPEVSRVLLFDTVLCMVRGKVIQYASRKKRAKNERLLELEKIISSKTNANVNDQQLQSAIEERDEIIEIRTKGNMFRCKVNWAAYAEKSSSYFFSLEKRKASSRNIPAMFLNHATDTGELSDKTEQMLNESTAFYAKLYKRVPRTNDIANAFLDSLERITDAQREECDLQITATELTAALSTLKPNTAPGPCGWTAEFFKCFWDIFCPLLLVVVHEIYERGNFPESFSRSITTLIPKKGKDKRYIENLRPISLLPVPYKIIAKAMALRLKKMISDMVHPDQTGFIKGRYIGENIRLIIDLMEHMDHQQMKGLIIQCDFLKAYDSISWEYLNEVVRAYGFGPNFQRWMSVFYPSLAHTARINVNNFLSPAFNIERGIRQGCPLSCLMWVLCMEPLLIKIRSNEIIRGIMVSDSEIKLSAYADDLTVILDGSEASLRNAVSVLDDFSSATGLKLNVGKTICAWVGSAKRQLNPICQDLNLKWLEEGGALDLLGIRIFHDANRTREVNYSTKMEEIKKVMSPWTQRSLTPLGRVILVKSLLLSKFVNLFAVINNPEKKIFARLESLIFKFIWGKKDKIKRSFAKKQFMEGGIGAPDVESFANALKVSWIKRWLNPENASWKLLVNDRFNVGSRFNIFQCAIGDRQIRSRHFPKFWDQALTAWAQIQQIGDEKDDVLEQPLFLNRNLNIEASLQASQLRLMDSQNIVHVKDLYNISASKWYTATEIKQKWSGLDIMTCNSLVSRIPIAWRTLQRQDDREPLAASSTFTKLNSLENTTKWAYRTILKPKLLQHCSCETKWNIDFEVTPDWTKLTKCLTASTNNIELRWLQFRIWHRILPTRKMLKIFGIIDNDQCIFCRQAVETMLHLLVDCPKVKTFWDQIWRAFKRGNVLYRTEELTPMKITCGVHRGGEYDLNLFSLLAKWFIWKQSKCESVLTIRLFLLHLANFKRVQACVYSMNGRAEEFTTLWNSIEVMMEVLTA